MAYISVTEMITQNYPEYIEKKSYPLDKVVAVGGTKEEWGVFGNFWKYPKKGRAPRLALVTIDGVGFDCTERLFQLMKLQDEECIRLVYAKPCGYVFKRSMARTLVEHGVEWRTDWPQMIVDVMKFCLQTKYEQCEFFRAELERSKGLYVIENETNHLRGKNPLWGVKQVGDHYEGPNVLGKLLMELRDNGKLEYTLPADALEFVKALK